MSLLNVLNAQAKKVIKNLRKLTDEDLASSYEVLVIKKSFLIG
jgi:hypothetical protein